MSQHRSSPTRPSLSDLGEETPTAPMLRATFSEAFERCFGRVYAYVSQRLDDRQGLERIVSEVLAANLDLLIERRGEAQEACRLKASADRLIALESAVRTRSRAVGA